MSGKLIENNVLIGDEREGNQIYNKGFFGEPQPGGGLMLSLIETTYLLEMDRLEVLSGEKRLQLKDLIRHATSVYPSFEIKYIVYRDLRQRGYVVKPAEETGLDFRVYPRGGIPNKNPSKYWVLALSERNVFDLATLSETLGRVIDLRKELLLGVVDEESDLTYYRVKRGKPKGQMVSKDGWLQTEGMLIEDRVLVPNEMDAKMMYDSEFFGKPLGKALQLSLIETAYMQEKKLITVRNSRTGRKLTESGFKKFASSIQPDFELRLRVYKDLKDRGIIVKTGFKYGAHFRGYEKEPDSDHARYLVHAVPENYRSMWPEISRAVRLAHGVKKEMLFGMCGEEIEYLKLERVRP